MLNVTAILHSWNIPWDTNNNSIKNDHTSLHGNIKMTFTLKTSLLIVALQMFYDIVVLALLASES